MGIKFFFKWLKSTFPSHIRTVHVHQALPVDIDHFLVDMNGIIHYCCQRIYQYGSFENHEKKQSQPMDTVDVFDDDSEQGDEKQSFSSSASSTSSASSSSMNVDPRPRQVQQAVLRYIDKIVRFVRPKKSVFLAIDGVAPLSKQFQQRSRRYRSTSSVVTDFDSNCITPGTQFLHELSNEIHHHIQRRVSREWSHLDVLFSSEKAPGEGEHKLVKWVREFGDKRDHFMMHGMDADLVMLALATHFPHFHILRENNYRPEYEFFHISVATIRQQLINAILQDLSEHPDQVHINDFIVMIFLTGNDFLPTIPTIELLDGGTEHLFQWYRSTIAEKGPLTNENGSLRRESFAQFLGNLSLSERRVLELKRSKSGRFPDPLLEAHTHLDASVSYGDEYDPERNDSMWRLDMEAYRKAYYLEKVGIDVDRDEAALKTMCLSYLEGVHWVLGYYLQGVPHWKWAYPYSYSPFLSDLVKYAPDLGHPSWARRSRDPLDKNLPFPSMLQLMCVLPPHSAKLLPALLATVYERLPDGYPKEIEVDVDGKLHDWEGIVRLPVLPWKEIFKIYNELNKHLDDVTLTRNRVGRTFAYKHGSRPTPHALMFD